MWITDYEKFEKFYKLIETKIEVYRKRFCFVGCPFCILQTDESYYCVLFSTYLNKEFYNLNSRCDYCKEMFYVD